MMCSATNLDEAIALEKAGMDIIVAQGAEAGGHRGTFMNYYRDSLIGITSLVPIIKSRVSIPVLAAGGIMDKRGVKAVMSVGADGAWIGTAFITTPESAISSLHREALLTTLKQSITTVSRAVTGRPCRMIRNRLVEELEKSGDEFKDLEGSFPQYYAATALADIIDKAKQLGKADLIPLLCGQGFQLCQNLPASQLMKLLTEDFVE